MMRRNVLSLIVFTVLVASAPVASYAQQAYQFGKCEVAPANKEAALRALHITMPDGVKIAADVILPRDLPAEAKLPTVLTQTRYWRATEGRQPTGADRYWINHGFAVVNTDVRGTGASFGRWPAPWSRDEVRDMGDVVKWIVAQAWSNGKVVTIGTSYTANTAELTSVSNHPAVKAVIPRFSDFDIYKQLIMPGGLFNDFMAREWENMVAAMDRNVKRGNPPIGVRPVDDDKDLKLLEAAVRDHQQNPSVYEASKAITFRDDRPKDWDASIDDLSAFSFRKEFERRKSGVVSVERARRDLLALVVRQDSVKLRVDWQSRISAIWKEPVENFAVAPTRITGERPPFIRRQIAVRAAFRFQRFEQLDRGDIMIKT